MKNSNWKQKLNNIRETLEICFADDTANKGSNRDVPSSGHCAVVAMLLHDMYGGEFVSTTINGQSHWYNKIYFGAKLMYMYVDLTGDQFGFPKVNFSFEGPLYENTRDRKESELNDETKNRFAVFKNRFFNNWIWHNDFDVEEELARILQIEIEKEIQAETGMTWAERDEKVMEEMRKLIGKSND